MKIIAMYLPQFHMVPENDQWWGEGFTEWTAVKGAKPLYVGHEQPRIPLNENYYDLTDKATMQWQANLMKRYGVDGICMYHYWFENGRRILEKPEQNLLKWTDIDMNYCFCWANESWARTWSKFNAANSWADVFDKSDKNEGDGLLLKQGYGEEQQWRDHFEYLVSFFKDERYIKKDNKPVFLIYKTKDIACFEEMSELWNALAKEQGFNGIYFICERVGQGQKGIAEGELYCAPGEPIDDGGLNLVNQQWPSIIEYDSVWQQILVKSNDNNTFYCGLSGFDNTPRMGRKGKIIVGSTPEKFGRYMAKIMKKSQDSGKDMVFVNAWNEWGEGMYLEPDVANGLSYLEALQSAKDNFESMEEYLPSASEMCKMLQREQRAKCKIQDNLETMLLWKELNFKGESLESLLIKENVKTINIYGWGVIGRLVYRELSESVITVKSIIDKNAVDSGVYIDRPGNGIPNADLTLVCVALESEAIKKSIDQNFAGRVCTFKEFISR